MNVNETPVARDLEVLSRTIYGEARGEPWQGLLAVGWVVRNRARRRDRFPNTIRQVCLQKYQFSCWNLNDPNVTIISTVTVDMDPAYLRCLAAAAVVMADEVSDPTMGADHYYQTRMSHPPSWSKDPSMRPTVVLGGHSFYKEKTPHERS